MKSQKPKAIIVDIDGTLALLNGRDPHDYVNTKKDLADSAVVDVTRRYAADSEYTVILITGRDMQWNDDTLEWLQEHDIPFDILYMRVHDDRKQDTVVKQGIYNKYVKDNFDVLFVMEDRTRVVKMWREEGLKVFQVVEGDY